MQEKENIKTTGGENAEKKLSADWFVHSESILTGILREIITKKIKLQNFKKTLDFIALK